MVPEILGVSVPDAFMAGTPPVNKLTLIKSNKDLREGDEEKKTATENCTLEEKMDTQSAQKTKRRQRRKNVTDSGARMEVGEGCQNSKELEDETLKSGVKMEVSKESKRSRGRRKKDDSHMDTSQSVDN